MSYVTVRSGYCTGENPGSGQNNNGGLRMYWELRCYTSAETVTIMNKSYSCAAGSYKLYYKLQAWYGVTIDSTILVTSGNGDSQDGYIRFRNGSSNLWSMVGEGFSYAGKCPRWGDNDPANTWYNVSDADWSNYYVYPEGLIAVSEGTTLSLNLTYDITLRYSTQYSRNVSKTSSSTSVPISGGKFTLHIDSDTGSNVAVTKDGTSLSDGATVYKNDILTILYSAKQGYELKSSSIQGTEPAGTNLYKVVSEVYIIIRTSPKATIHKRRNGEWAIYLIYIRRSGSWGLHQANRRRNGNWDLYF